MDRKQKIAIVVGAVVLIVLGLALVTGGFRSVFRTWPGGTDFDHATTQMANSETCIVLYRRTHGRLPSDLQVLTEVDASTGEEYIDRIPNDPWGNPYE